MRIAINALTTRGRAGVRSYLGRVSVDMARVYAEDQFLVFINREVLEDFADLPSNIKVVSFDLSRFRVARRVLIEQFWLPLLLRRERCDIVYTLAVMDIFASPCPSIIRIGNMLPYTEEAMALQTSLRNRARLTILRALTAVSRGSADATLVMSGAAADILVERCEFSPQKTIGINRGVSPSSTRKEPYSDQELGFPFILVVSHIVEYKRLPEIADAVVRLGASLGKAKVVIAGEVKDPHFASYLDDVLARHGLADHVIKVGHVPRGQLGDLMDRSLFTIFPSMVETCPVTLIEMMMAGCAMVVSNQSVMPALCGDSVLYYDPRDSAALAARMSELLASRDLREQLGDAVRARVDTLGIDWPTALAARRLFFQRVVDGAELHES